MLLLVELALIWVLVRVRGWARASAAEVGARQAARVRGVFWGPERRGVRATGYVRGRGQSLFRPGSSGIVPIGAENAYTGSAGPVQTVPLGVILHA